MDLDKKHDGGPLPLIDSHMNGQELPTSATSAAKSTAFKSLLNDDRKDTSQVHAGEGIEDGQGRRVASIEGKEENENKEEGEEENSVEISAEMDDYRGEEGDEGDEGEEGEEEGLRGPAYREADEDNANDDDRLNVDILEEEEEDEDEEEEDDDDDIDYYSDDCRSTKKRNRSLSINSADMACRRSRRRIES